jgi:hypothetical protein
MNVQTGIGPFAERNSPDLSGIPAFSADEVRHNQEGRLSPRQRHALRQQLLSNGAALVLGVAWCGWVAHLGGGLLLVVGVLSIAIAGNRLVRQAMAMATGRVTYVDGDAWTECVPDSDGPDDYWLHVAGLRLETEKVVHQSLQPGGPYRIYYLPKSRRAVSAQALHGWREIPRTPPKRRFRLPISIEVG